MQKEVCRYFIVSLRSSDFTSLDSCLMEFLNLKYLLSSAFTLNKIITLYLIQDTDVIIYILNVVEIVVVAVSK